MSSDHTTLTHRSGAGLPAELPADAGRAATGIAIVLVAQLMLVLDATVVNVALPRIDTALGFGPASLSWVLNSYTLAFGGLLLLGGRLGDVRGRLRMFEIGLAVFTLFSLLGGLAQTPGELIAARALQGAGAAMAAPSVLALLTTSAPDEAARNRALALFGAVSSAGASIGLLLGGVVTDLGSWRWTLFINVPIGLAVLLLAPRFVKETPRRPGRFDVVGAVTATLGAVAIVWSFIGTPEHGWLSVRTIGGFAVGLALLGILARTEARHPHPLIQPHLVRNRRRVAALASMALVIGANLSMFFLVVQYDERVLGLGPFQTGLAFLPFSLGVFGMSRITPRLITWLGPRLMVMIGSARPGRRLRLAQPDQRHRRLLGLGLRTGADRGPVDRLHLHADHRDGAGRRRARARRLGIGPAADHAAARCSSGRGRDRLGVRHRRGPRPVRARRASRVPDLGRVLARRSRGGDRGPAHPSYAGPGRRRAGARAGARRGRLSPSARPPERCSRGVIRTTRLARELHLCSSGELLWRVGRKCLWCPVPVDPGTCRTPRHGDSATYRETDTMHLRPLLGAATLALVAALTTTVGSPLGTTAPAADSAISNPVTPGAFRGFGFDQCLAPTQSAMDTWLRQSPYLAVGIYISGASRACRVQPNLTKTWVATQLARRVEAAGRSPSDRRRPATRGSRATATTR